MRADFLRCPVRLAVLIVGLFSSAAPGVASQTTPESGFVELGDVRLHFLDFGGAGVPVLLLHSKPWDAWTYDGFGQLLTAHHRVLAPTFRGSGASEGVPSDVATDGKDILQFMDALGLERAVLVGNSTPGLAMTYLAERHPNRVAGLIYLASALALDIAGEDPWGIWEMALRSQGENYARNLPQREYRPDYLRSAGPTIYVPTLVFRNSDGASGTELFDVPTMLVEGAIPIEDPEARQFFEALRDDPSTPEKISELWDTILARERAGSTDFDAAFSPPAVIVRLDLPMVGGYEYRETPNLLLPSILEFLGRVREAEEANRRRPHDRSQLQGGSTF